MMTNGSDHITANEFRLWLEAARPGDRIVYLTGHLVRSLGDKGKKSRSIHLAALVAIANEAWEARNRVCLVQRRVGPGHFEYIAIRNAA